VRRVTISDRGTPSNQGGFGAALLGHRKVRGDVYRSSHFLAAGQTLVGRHGEPIGQFGDPQHAFHLHGSPSIFHAFRFLLLPSPISMDNIIQSSLAFGAVLPPLCPDSSRNEG
jgi:hypothetical protein